jgi:hypothetical protein
MEYRRSKPPPKRSTKQLLQLSLYPQPSKLSIERFISSKTNRAQRPKVPLLLIQGMGFF